MRKVMIVDDEKPILDLFEVIQEVCDFTIVAEAFTGEDAIEKYSTLKIKPDVVIMDQRMPDMDGVEATRKILSIDKSAKILFVSGDPLSEEEARSAGAIGFLEKPFGLKELNAAIEKALKEK